MSGHINGTFRECLLESPRPKNRALYDEYFNLMFPDVEHFEHFLACSRHEDQVRYARIILLRLATESTFTPSNRLILNLLDFESHLGSQSNQRFIGRDHFIHLVNLYLLGLYVFWYHNGFQRTLLNHFRKKSKVDQAVKASSVDASGVGLFLSAWTNFVLMHDLFYPMEVQGGNPNYFGFIKPLGKISKNLEKDLALQCLSRLVAFQMLLDSSTIELLEDCYRNDFRGGVLTRRTIQPNLFDRASLDFTKWNQARKMPLNLGNSLLPVLKVIFGDANILLVLERSIDRRPVWMMECDSRTQLILEENLLSGKPKEEFNYFLAAVGEGNFNTARLGELELVCFVRDFDALFAQACTRCLHNSATGPSDIALLAKSYAKSDPVPFSLASSYRDFNDCAFHVYQILLRDLDYLLDDEDFSASLVNLNQKFKTGQGALKSLEKRLAREMGRFLTELVRKRVRSLNREGVKVTSTELPKYVKELMLSLANTDQMVREFTARMTDHLSRRLETDSTLRTAYASVRREISQVTNFIEDKEFEDSDSLRQTLFESWFSYFGDSDNEITATLKERCALSGLNSEMLRSYRPDYADDNAAHIDHGLGAALLAVQIGERLLKVWDELASSKDIALPLATVFRSRCTGNERLVLEETCYAILVHNLYPEHFPNPTDQQFRTSLKTSPFAYFAMFCDSLQPWDRKRLANQAYVDGAYGTASADFNLSIKGDTVFISESGHGLSIEDRLNSLRKYLDSYLESASRLVKLSLSEK